MCSYNDAAVEFWRVPGNSERSRRCSTQVHIHLIIHSPFFHFSPRIWSNRLEDEQLQEISQQMQLLHSSIKNIMEYVFATSPLLALSTNGWKRRISGAHLLTVSHLSIPLVSS
jgi:hypothetical protein